MFPFPAASYLPLHRFLRASGGVSPGDITAQYGISFSPRKRRCFLLEDNSTPFEEVFSAQAEVFPSYRQKATESHSFLRASGGVSCFQIRFACHVRFSPRKRRCFSVTSFSCFSENVFSAQAEVFLKRSQLRQPWRCFLRASGGVSEDYREEDRRMAFSPRKRRCFRCSPCRT